MDDAAESKYARLFAVWMSRSDELAPRPAMPESLRGLRPPRRSKEKTKSEPKAVRMCSCGNEAKLNLDYCRKCKPKPIKTQKPAKPPTPSRPVSNQATCPCGNIAKMGLSQCRRCLGKPTKAERKKNRLAKRKAKRSNPSIGFNHAAKHIARKKARAGKKPGMTGKEWYAEVYLKSDWWKERRKLKLDTCGRKCNRCPSIKNLQVHHLSYERKYAELDTDLEVLCKPCHEAEHGQKFPDL